MIIVLSDYVVEPIAYVCEKTEDLKNLSLFPLCSYDVWGIKDHKYTRVDMSKYDWWRY